MAPPRGLYAGRRRAPRGTGATVFGVYYPPYAWLPAGTTDIQIRSVQPIPVSAQLPGGTTHLTVMTTVTVGMTAADIESKIKGIFQDFLDKGSTSPKNLRR